MVRVGIIGYGYWGPNIVRNFQSLGSVRVVAICDSSDVSLKRAQEAYPNVRVTQNSEDVLTATDIDAVAVITPVWTHYALAKAALLNGKHVFVEKPFTSSSREAEELIELAERAGLTIMGKLYYYASTRLNLGLFQHDVNVLWDLAPHDLSIVDYLVGQSPEAVVATGVSHLNGLADMAFLTAYFPGNIIAHINVNWLSPVKIRTTLIGGDRKMLVWNDLEADEKIKVYDKGVKIASREGVYDLLVSYRSGDMWSPKIEATEALRLELTYFIECIEKQQRPFNDGQAGLRVVRILEAAETSLKRKGEAVYA